MSEFRSRPDDKNLYVETSYTILYEDDFFLAVDKPSPLPVHPVGRFAEKNLLSLLEKNGIKAPEKLKVINRLDSETSGVVLVAKDSRTAGRLGRQFEKRTVKKEYTGIAIGVFDRKEGRIDTALGSTDENRYFRCVPDPAGKPAETRYKVLEERNGYSLLRLVPLTGRTHQIRAHLAFAGHPLAGDKVYIDIGVYDRYVHEGWKEDMLEIVRMPRLALHASRLAVDHPEDSRRMEFCAKLPGIFLDFLGLPDRPDGI